MTFTHHPITHHPVTRDPIITAKDVVALAAANASAIGQAHLVAEVAELLIEPVEPDPLRPPIHLRCRLLHQLEVVGGVRPLHHVGFAARSQLLQPKLANRLQLCKARLPHGPSNDSTQTLITQRRQEFEDGEGSEATPRLG
jgi:hypothetical protein